MESICKSRCCCFTGHRPGENLPVEEEVLPLLQRAIQEAVQDGYTTFISGMAQGLDIWAAEQVLELKNANPSLRLVCALPFEGFEKGWTDEWKQRYAAIMKRADEIRCISRSMQHKGVFQLRNRWMVDHSSRVIALYQGGPGGTWNTVKYCMKQGVELKMLRVEN